MKKILLSIAALLAILSIPSFADTVTINLESVQLLTSGSSPVPNNMLVQLLGDTTSTFGAPTAANFDGNDANEAVLWSGTVSTISSVAGAVQAQIILTLGGTDTNVGNYLLLRWYPTLSLAASVPGAGTTYGQFDTLSEPDGSTMDWQIPSAGTYDLNFVTNSEGGSQPNSAGVASFTVPVPEPGSLSLVAGAFAIGATILRRRKRH